MTSIPFYIGTYTAGISRGIYRSRLDLETGNLSTPALVAEVANPMFLAIHPTLDVLYCTSEVRRDGKRENAQITAFKIVADGGLVELGSLPAGGNGPCFVSTDHAGKFAFVANYGSGSISAFSLAPNGELITPVCNIQHLGKSIDASRQEGPHAHCILVDPSDKYVCAVDLGLDQVVIYALDRSTGDLVSTGKPFNATPGFGPRHLAFHPNGKHAFVIHELASRLSSCEWDANSGTLTEMHHLSTLPAGYSQASITAEVLVHPSGRFVYGSNRGHDSIATFGFDELSGRLTLLGHTSTMGKTPRNFRLDPSGSYLLVENQDSDTILPFRIDSGSGALQPVGDAITVGMPCCIKFFR